MCLFCIIVTFIMKPWHFSFLPEKREENNAGHVCTYTVLLVTMRSCESGFAFNLVMWIAFNLFQIKLAAAELPIQPEP